MADKSKPELCTLPDCFSCPYEDCRYEQMTLDDYVEIRLREKSISANTGRKCQDIREYKRRYYLDNREEIKLRAKKYYTDHLQQERSRMRKYYETHIEEMRERDRKYYEEHRDEILERKRQRSRTEDFREKRRKYREENRERINAARRERYARKKQEQLEKVDVAG